LKQVSIAADGSVRSKFVTSDSHHKVDAFPFQSANGSLGFIAGLDLSVDGAFYAYENSRREYILRSPVTFRAEQTDLLIPGGAQSFEPFLWMGEQYASYQVVEQGSPMTSSLSTSSPGEIWVAKLGANSFACRVSVFDESDNPLSPYKRARMDAEPILYAQGTKAALFYHSAQPIPKGAPLLADLRRIDLGEKAAFDAACAKGMATPAPTCKPSPWRICIYN
jgi:hypothetical protein